MSADEWRVRHGSVDDLLNRAQTQIDLFKRRQTTAVPGTISIVRDLAAEVERLRTELSHGRPVVDAAVAWAEAWAEASGESGDFWEGEGGTQDIADAAARRDSGGNRFAGWKVATPALRHLVDKRRALLVAVGRLWRETQEAGR